MRWSISWQPHAAGTDRGNPRDAGELDACQRAETYFQEPQKCGSVYFLFGILRQRTRRKFIGGTLEKHPILW